ncbi:MAG: bifunctional DNA-formamidopyrimidine glycosylase/DNA-(apurinic or apyrimidinic site) lyase [Pseudomonadota bacterium]
MPELPEVETTRSGIAPHIEGRTLTDVIVRNASLRWPVPVAELRSLVGVQVQRVTRRAKYLLLYTNSARVILLHLGMSGSLHVVAQNEPALKHDHLELIFDDQTVVRLNDPRRFGCCLLLHEPVFEHALLKNLGPEPLSDEFDGDYLFKASRRRKLAVKNFIMDGKVVVGVGNIYASESLFGAGIRPTMQAGKVSRQRYVALAAEIKAVLANAIAAGGTTLSDFLQADGKPGYFRHELQVYGRAGETCFNCDQEVKVKVIGQRSTFYCSQCQPF